MGELFEQIDWASEGDRCVELLARLIRIPTVNPPGNERAAAELLAEFVREAGLEPKLVEPEPGRTSMVVRVKGDGTAPPLLLAGHTDVVEADAAQWKKDPFAGVIEDGWVWGRGAVDMKNMIAMSACVVTMLARHRVPLKRDVIFAAVADEEAGCDKGSRYLVDEHPELVRAEYMLGEVGGFSMKMMGRTFYPIMVAEKGVVWVKATFRGEPGHGSMPKPDSAVVRAGEALVKLGKTKLPVHLTEPAKRFLSGLTSGLPIPTSALVALGKSMPKLAPMLSNTATPTVLRAGSKTNVIPGEASVEIDGRTLPGQTEQDFLRELRELIGGELEVIRSMPPVVSSPDTMAFDVLAKAIKRHDPSGIPVPYMIPGFTDAKAFSRLGTKCYGFVPLQVDGFSRMFHGNDERIPVAGLKWGLRVLAEAVGELATSD